MLRLPDPPAFFLDFDGCLVGIAPTPNAVVVPVSLKRSLARLWSLSGGALALVSGRPLSDLRRFLSGLAVPAIGSHGAERATGAEGLMGPHRRIAVDADALASLVGAVHDLADTDPGFLVEEKPVAVALHYRRAPGREDEVRARLAEIVGKVPGFHAHHSKMAVELRPDGAEKGTAVADLMTLPPFRGRRPVVMGDDLTDEPAFAVGNARGGLTVKVGPGATLARHRLPDPIRVRALLARWGAEA